MICNGRHSGHSAEIITNISPRTALRRPCALPCALIAVAIAANSEIGFGAKADDRNRPAVAVIGGIDHELIIDRGLPVVHRKQIIGLDDLLRARMRQLSIADQDALDRRHLEIARGSW